MTFSRTTTMLTLLLILLLVIGLSFWLRPRSTPTPGECTHWASPQGTGTSCTETAPCRVSAWWSLAGPGLTLCLVSGEYRGADSMIDPPDGLAGTQAQPITVKALHDGAVLLDAEHQRAAVWLAPGNDWFVIEGFNATNGKEALYNLNGSYGRGKRLIGWEGTAGQADSNIFRVGRQYNTVIEDCAGWGVNSRKIFDGAQSQMPNKDSGWSGFRRCWGEFNGWPAGESEPTNTYQMGYNARQQRFENILGAWNTLGATGGPESVLALMENCYDQDMSVRGSAVLGGLFYTLPGQRFDPSSLAHSTCTSDAVWRDIAAILSPGFPGKYPFSMVRSDLGGGPQVNNVCTNCLGVYQDGQPSRIQDGTGWTFPGFREGRTLADAMKGANVYDALPGLCYRYQDGVLTTEGLWPWPMGKRILEASRASGRAEVDIDAIVAAILGPPPDKCRSDRQPVPPDPVPPAVSSLTCTGDLLAGGKISMACQPVTRQR